MLFQLLVGLATIGCTSDQQSKKIVFSPSLYDLEFLKTGANQSWEMLYGTCTGISAEQVSQDLEPDSIDMMLDICTEYQKNIEAHLENLSVLGKSKLLQKIVIENCEALTANRNPSLNEIFYHRYCIQFAEERLNGLNQQIIVQQLP